MNHRRLAPALGLALLLLAMALTGTASAADFREVSFQASDGATVYANLYGKGDQAVVLAHGRAFNKESWDAQAQELVKSGLLVLAIDFRGYGKSAGEGGYDAMYADVLGAVRYLRQNGAHRVSVVGGSMGGGAAALASSKSKEGEIDRLILLAAAPSSDPEKLKGRKLFIVSRGDGFAPDIQQAFEHAAEPKQLVLLEGSAHAQHLFKTEQGPQVLELIRDWLTNE
ncbi:MAG: alpha/beta fold hydrolase [Acidobacteria bacterium]|nr:alpha/beta fold hydrolase [Acidobacteriota bacterium]MDA1236233.1 alpha/beta fold hydrolase [Acidobacteriota bacterium]